MCSLGKGEAKAKMLHFWTWMDGGGWLGAKSDATQYAFQKKYAVIAVPTAITKARMKAGGSFWA